MSECRTFCFTDLDGSTLAWGVSPIAVMTFALLICTVWETKTKLNSTDPRFVKLTYISIISAMISNPLTKPSLSCYYHRIRSYLLCVHKR